MLVTVLYFSKAVVSGPLWSQVLDFQLVINFITGQFPNIVGLLWNLVTVVCFRFQLCHCPIYGGIDDVENDWPDNRKRGGGGFRSVATQNGSLVTCKGWFSRDWRLSSSNWHFVFSRQSSGKDTAKFTSQIWDFLKE